MSTNGNGDIPDLLIGQTIANGKYSIARVLGEGGMGKVYQGEQKLGDLKRPVAIKTLQPELAQDPQLVTRFLREAGTVGLLEHPNTIKFYESGQLDDGKLFVAMEFIQGESLAHVIARGPIPPQRVEHILSQVCGSLGEAHEHGIVHRDIKPENIILTQKGSKGDFVKVLDFGIAKRDESAEDAAHAKLTRQGMVLGTPPYMSPEQFTGMPLKPMSDIYSLAIVAYEMLTGTLPFQAATPWEWATKHLTAAPTPFEAHPAGAAVPPRHKAAVMRALSKKAEERPQTMQQFLAELTGNAGVGNDWSQATNSAPNAFGSMQGAGGQFTPAPIPQAATPYPGGQPGVMTAPAGSGGVPATMAVNYPQPTPQPFHATPNPGAFAANSGAGFQPVNQPPSNPGFQPQPMNAYGGYSQQGYGQPMPQKSGGAGKFIVIGVVGLLLLGGIGAAVVGSSSSGGNSGNTTNNNTNNTANNTNPPANNTNVPGVNTNPPVNNGMQPVPANNGMQPVPANNGMQPIPTNNGMQPIPTNNGMQPIPANNGMQPLPTNRPSPPRPSVPSVCRGGASRIDDLILNGRCAAAQTLYRQMRAAGCTPRDADQSFGSACQRP